MIKKMKLEAYVTSSKTGGGGVGLISHELIYEGDTIEEIANQIMDDENALYEYMNTGKDHGQKCFMFRGLMLRKAPLVAAHITEADF